MTLLYNIITLEQGTNNDPVYLVKALEDYYKGKTLAKNAFEKYKPLNKSLKGSSFLVNPKDFFNDKTTDVMFKAQYISLSGRRDFYMYSTYKISHLDISFIPEINIPAIQQNPLIQIKNNTQIYFKYEELNNGNRIWQNQR